MLFIYNLYPHPPPLSIPLFLPAAYPDAVTHTWLV